jgi:C4-dicarboxylate transporter DctM subunit
MVMETLAAVIILAPLCLSIVLPLGVDPIHFGVIMTVNLVIGMCTPPVGVNLFVASRIGGLPIEAMFKWLVLMLGSLVVVLMLVTYIPQLSLVLPNLMHMLR